MAVLMEHDLVGIFHREVEQDKVAVLAALVESCKLDGFALPQWNKVAQLAGVAEGDNLERHREVDRLLGEQRPKDKVHLFEAQGHIPGAAVAGIGDHGKMRRVHFNPLGFLVFAPAGNCEQQKCERPGDNLIVENIPTIPASVAEKVRQYSEFRSAAIQDWDPVRREMLITTRFADVPQVHLVKMPGGSRTQLTFFPDRVGGAHDGPKGSNY